jgi:signal transduction histidine kinase
MSAAAEFSWLTDSESELRSIFYDAPIGLAQCQPRGEITALNPALERMFGGQGRFQHFADLVHPAQKAESERLLCEMFEGKRSSFELDSKSALNGLAIHWTAWRISGRSRNLDYALVLAQSVPENQESDGRQLQSQRLEAVGRLAGGVAHDFNNLLTGVLLYCDLLMSSLEQGHRARKYAEEIRNAGVQATGLVRQLLAMARPTSSGPRLLSLNDVAEGMRNLLLRLIGENIRLEFHLDSKLGLVEMDQTQAQQILLNLVLNARDAMPAGGQIAVKTSNCRIQILPEQTLSKEVLPEAESGSGNLTSLPCALFAVEDNGSGMDATTRAHAFDEFFTTKAGKGTGIGLATVRDIVTRNGGLIHLDSSEHRGTRVTVLLPLVSDATRGSQNASPVTAKKPVLSEKLEKKEGALPNLKEE